MTQNKGIGSEFDQFMEEARQDPEVASYLNSFSVAIGNLVLARRMQLGLTQKELAKRANTTQARISHIEAGFDGVKLESLNKIFKVLGLADLNPIYREDAATSYKVYG
jgi:DNA-binding XRE family transcriptional regulator